VRSLRDQLKDPLVRAGWTAAEAFLAVVIGSGVMDLSVSTLQAAGIAATSAALTVVLAWVRQQRTAAEMASSATPATPTAPAPTPEAPATPTSGPAPIPDLDDLLDHEAAIDAAAAASDETGWPWDIAPAPRRPGDDYGV
jgi:hypothetical protein